MKTSFYKPYWSQILIFLLYFQLTGGLGCSQKFFRENEDVTADFRTKVFSDTSDFYHVNFTYVNNTISATSPIGVFDSGTGGLTVLDALLDYDRFDRVSQKYIKEGDGVKDFEHERFIYFGDQANMPYGNYPAMNKTPFLKELILRDALFLLGNNRYTSSADSIWQTDKEAVKIIVVACNTATAYGKEDIEKMLTEADCKIPVIGVIDAGVRGALSTFDKKEDGTAAVIATEGTVSSNGYLNTFISQKALQNYSGDLEFIQQSGYGIAEAIDEEINFTDRQASNIRIGYRGPSLNNERWKIEEVLLPIYNFDTTGNALLYQKENGRYTEIQLNSTENYIRYHLVNLCEQLKQKQVEKPLKTLILGCTHYPFYKKYIQNTLKELYNTQVDGNYIYRDYLATDVNLIDPAENTAKEVHQYLVENNLQSGNKKNTHEFYISVPNFAFEAIQIDSTGNFTYEYKYNRDVNHFYDTKQVPMNSMSVNKNILERLEIQVPNTYEMMKEFNRK